jgi:hypothetical protein
MFISFGIIYSFSGYYLLVNHFISYFLHVHDVRHRYTSQITGTLIASKPPFKNATSEKSICKTDASLGVMKGKIKP